MLVSFLMTVRVRTDLSNSNTRDIIKFFNDILKITSSEDRKKMEFLIRFDSDNIEAQNVIKDLSQLPLSINTFTYCRWEGMETIHHAYTYLLCRIHPESNFIIICGDDAIPLNLNINSLEQFRDNDYTFFTSLSRMTEKEWLTKADYTPPFTKCMESLNRMRLVEPYPVISRKLLEICSGFGFCSNIDGWLALLNLILYNKYGILIVKNLPHLMFSRGNTQSQDIVEKEFISKFNKDMENIPYYFDLINQQAENIYLNIKKNNE